MANTSTSATRGDMGGLRGGGGVGEGCRWYWAPPYGREHGKLRETFDGKVP